MINSKTGEWQTSLDAVKRTDCSVQQWSGKFVYKTMVGLAQSIQD